MAELQPVIGPSTDTSQPRARAGGLRETEAWDSLSDNERHAITETLKIEFWDHCRKHWPTLEEQHVNKSDTRCTGVLRDMSSDYTDAHEFSMAYSDFADCAILSSINLSAIAALTYTYNVSMDAFARHLSALMPRGMAYSDDHRYAQTSGEGLSMVLRDNIWSDDRASRGAEHGRPMYVISILPILKDDGEPPVIVLVDLTLLTPTSWAWAWPVPAGTALGTPFTPVERIASIFSALRWRILNQVRTKASEQWAAEMSAIALLFNWTLEWNAQHLAGVSDLTVEEASERPSKDTLAQLNRFRTVVLRCRREIRDMCKFLVSNSDSNYHLLAAQVTQEAMDERQSTHELAGRILQTRGDNIWHGFESLGSIRPNDPARPSEEAHDIRQIGVLLGPLERSVQRLVEVIEESKDTYQLLIAAITNQDAEVNQQQAQRATMLALLAAIYLPLTLATGIFGMNIREISRNSGPPWWTVLLCAVVLGLIEIPFVLWLFIGQDLKQKWETSGKRHNQGDSDEKRIGREFGPTRAVPLESVPLDSGQRTRIRLNALNRLRNRGRDQMKGDDV